MKADDIQIGGQHYKDMGIQPWEFFEANFTKEQFSAYLKMEIIAYLMRNKNGLEDILKAQHIIAKLVEVNSIADEKSIKVKKDCGCASCSCTKLITQLESFEFNAVLSELYQLEGQYIAVIIDEFERNTHMYASKLDFTKLTTGMNVKTIRETLENIKPCE